MSKKVLIIDESKLVRDYLTLKLQEFDFEVIQALNGLDGSVKLRNEIPELVVMDYFLSRKGSEEILREKMENRNVADIPVIMTVPKVDRSNLVKLAKYNVKKIFSKPIKMDSFINAVSELLGTELAFDDTPCIIEAHFNDDILFIEVAQGLNTEKIELLKFKITELLELYQVEVPKILIMMSNIEIDNSDIGKLSLLLTTVLEYGKTFPKFVKILTTIDTVKEFITDNPEFAGMEAADNLGDAMDELLGLKPDQIAHDEVVSDRLLRATAPKKEGGESIQMRFDSEKAEKSETKPSPVALPEDLEVAIVDDDIVIQQLVQTVFSETGWKLSVFENGKKFVDSLPNRKFSLVFLDLMMPEMNGFQVLQHLKEQKIQMPIIVFSALSRKETVVKAVSFGIHSYLIKPLKPLDLMNKAAEVLNANF